MIIAHSWCGPVIYESHTDGKTYMICDGRYIEVPTGTTWKDIMWVRRPMPGQKNEMFKIRLDWEVDGSKGKKYKVKKSMQKVTEAWTKKYKKRER